MLTRISSFHNYQSIQNDLRRQEAKINHNQAQLASGKRLQSASDDPLATHYLQNIDQQSEQLKQYINSIVMVRNRLEHHEVLIADSASFLDNAKRNVMEMINGALSLPDREAKAKEVSAISNNLLTLANSKDEAGNYIFAGTKSKSQPFFRDHDGSVSYVGDGYQRKMRIATNLDMPMNDPGNKVFMEIDNPFGDYQANYDLKDKSELLLEKATNSNYQDHANYSVTFVDMDNGKFGYQLSKNGKAVKADTFDPVKGIQYQGLTIHTKGQITKDDTINLTPEKTFSVFDTFNNINKYASSSVSDASATAQLQQATEKMSAAFAHVNKVRTDVGVRLNTLDIQQQQHEDFNFSLMKSKSSFEDLDYSKAIIEFNENSRALQASQQAFGKTKDLTLFNYI